METFERILTMIMTIMMMGIKSFLPYPGDETLGIFGQRTQKVK